MKILENGRKMNNSYVERLPPSLSEIDPTNRWADFSLEIS